MHANEQLIQRFYEAFGQRDAAAMNACYHDEVVFSDPVFGELRGQSVKSMWRMLCEQGVDLNITYSAISADGEQGKATWVAMYTFSPTGRMVVNRVRASFTFRDGKIVAHHDSFDLRAWMRSALGVMGLFMSWIPGGQATIRTTAKRGLEQWMQKRNGGGERVQGAVN